MDETTAAIPHETDPTTLPPITYADARYSLTGRARRPLVIDLDGTLLNTNLLVECVIAFVKQRPLSILHMLYWLLRGRAFLKQQLARHVQLDTSLLPLNADIKAYALGEKARGGRVYLATAADRSLADAIAERCGFFDGVLASDGRVNLKGKYKRDALCRRFPEGFVYAGDSNADIPVWKQASEVVLVGSASWTRRTARYFSTPTVRFPLPSRLRALFKCARPHQWAKNVLIFAPALLSGEIRNTHALATTFVSFVALCIVASATYIINDLWDLSDDRRHWSKCHRPIASGALPVAVALSVAPCILAAGLALGFLAASAVGLALVCYTAITLCYSLALKRIPVLDVTVLAGLFTLRLVMGALSAHVIASPWLIVLSMFLFSSLCFAKRYVEVSQSAARSATAVAGRGYQAGDHVLMMALGASTSAASIVVMVFYIIFDAFQQTFFGNTEWLWAFPLILYLWLGRIWLMASRGKLDDDPVAFAMRDVPSLLLGVAVIVSFLFAWQGLLG